MQTEEAAILKSGWLRNSSHWAVSKVFGSREMTDAGHQLWFCGVQMDELKRHVSHLAEAEEITGLSSFVTSPVTYLRGETS